MAKSLARGLIPESAECGDDGESSQALFGNAYTYLAIGTVLGLSDHSLGRVAQQFGMKPGAATAVSVNALMPLAAIGLGLAHRRVALAWIGAAIMTCGFIAGLAARYPAAIRDWSLGSVFGSVPPLLIVAMLGYAVLGSVAVWLWQARNSTRRKQAQPDAPS